MSEGRNPFRPFSLAGRTALVTGGGRGIGREIALTFAGAGADVAVCGRTPGTLAETVQQVTALGQRGLAVRADITSEADIAAMVDQVMAAFGRIDVLVNNAGDIASWERMVTMPLAHWEAVLRSHATGTFLVGRAVAAHMLAAGSGAVVNISSISGRRGQKTMAHYGAAKAAVIGLTKSMAVEWAPAVRANCIAVGVVDAPEDPHGFGSDENRQRFARRTLLGRLGTRADVALAALYLASDASKWVTGATLDVNGGEYLG